MKRKWRYLHRSPERDDDRHAPEPVELAQAERPAPSEPDELARIEFDREHFIDRPEPSEPLPLPEIRTPARTEADSAPLPAPVEPIERRQERAAMPELPPVQDNTPSANPHADATPIRRTSQSAPILVESEIAGIPRRFPGTTMVPRTNLQVPEIITSQPQPPSMEVDFEPGVGERRRLDPEFHGATPKAPASSPGQSTPPLVASRRTGSQPTLATSAGSLSIRRAETGFAVPAHGPAGRRDEPGNVRLRRSKDSRRNQRRAQFGFHRLLFRDGRWLDIESSTIGFRRPRLSARGKRCRRRDAGR